MVCLLDFWDLCLSTSTHFWTTSTDEVAWPQGGQFLGGDPWHKAILPTTQWLSLPFYTPEGAWPLCPLAGFSGDFAVALRIRPLLPWAQGSQCFGGRVVRLPVNVEAPYPSLSSKPRAQSTKAPWLSWVISTPRAPSRPSTLTDKCAYIIYYQTNE